MENKNRKKKKKIFLLFFKLTPIPTHPRATAEITVEKRNTTHTQNGMTLWRDIESRSWEEEKLFPFKIVHLFFPFHKYLLEKRDTQKKFLKFISLH